MQYLRINAVDDAVTSRNEALVDSSPGDSFRIKPGDRLDAGANGDHRPLLPSARFQMRHPDSRGVGRAGSRGSSLCLHTAFP